MNGPLRKQTNRVPISVPTARIVGFFSHCEYGPNIAGICVDECSRAGKREVSDQSSVYSRQLLSVQSLTGEAPSFGVGRALGYAENLRQSSTHSTWYRSFYTKTVHGDVHLLQITSIVWRRGANSLYFLFSSFAGAGSSEGSFFDTRAQNRFETEGALSPLPISEVMTSISCCIAASRLCTLAFNSFTSRTSTISLGSRPLEPPVKETIRGTSRELDPNRSCGEWNDSAQLKLSQRSSSARANIYWNLPLNKTSCTIPAVSWDLEFGSSRDVLQIYVLPLQVKVNCTSALIFL